MGLPWKIISENIINISETLQDLLDTREKKDIRWLVKDKLGNVMEYTLPNIAKIKEELSEVTVKAMSKTEYDHLREDRKKIYAGTGQIDEESDFTNFLKEDAYGSKTFIHTKSYPSDRYLKNSLAFPLHEEHFNTRRYNPKFNVDGHIIRLYGTGGNYENLKGDDTWNGNTFGIKLPDAVSVDKIISDLRNIEADINHGDVVLVKADGVNLFKDPAFEEELGTNWIPYTGTTLEVTDGSIIVKDADMYHGFYQKVSIMPGVKYRVEIDVDFMDSDNYEAYVWLGSSGRNGEYYTRPKATEGPNGKLIVEFVATNYVEIIQFQVHTLSSEKPLGDVKFTNPRLTVLEDVLVVNNGDDLSVNSDMCDPSRGPTALIRSMYGNARKDLVFLEVWTEDIDKKDVVYRLGNVQWYGKDILDNGKLVQPNWFEGYEEYSLFGNWQNSGELIGYGYRWSYLTNEEKNKFISDPENNIFKDENGILKQVRYRIRVIKGVSNFFKKVDALVEGSAYNGPLSVFADKYYHVKPKGEKSHIDNDITKWTGDSFFPSTGVYLSSFYPGSFKSRHNDTHAVPLFLIQRRNNGIYHPVHNPNGTASYIENGKALSLSGYFDKIKRLADCFNSDHVAYYKPDTGESISETNYLGLDDKTGWYRTGETKSTILRPDNMPLDGAGEIDIVDLRRDGRNRTLEEIMTKTLRLHADGNINGYETPSDYIKVKVDLDSSRRKVKLGTRSVRLENDRINDMFPVFGSNINKPVYFYDINGNYLGFTKLQCANMARGTVSELILKEPAPENAYHVRIPIPNYTDATGYNKRVTTALLLGNLTSFKETYDYEAISGVSNTVTIKINDLVKVGDEYYMSIVDDITIDLDPEKEDYSNASRWYRVNDNGEEIYLAENELKANTEAYSLRKLITYTSSDELVFEMPYHVVYGYDSIHQILLRLPDGRIIEALKSDDDEHIWFSHSYSSVVYIKNVSREIDDIRELIAKGQIVVIYSRTADPLTVLQEGEIKRVNDVVYSSSTVYNHHFGALARILVDAKLDGGKYGLGASIKRNQTSVEVINRWPGYWLEHHEFDDSYGRPRHAVKFLPYIDLRYETLYQSYLFREQLNENITPDINRLRYDGSYIYKDYNNNNDEVIYGIKRIKLPYFKNKSGV